MSHRFRFLSVIGIALCVASSPGCSETEGPADAAAAVDSTVETDIPVAADVVVNPDTVANDVLGRGVEV